MNRCYNKNVDAYPHYGGRGIVVCDRWRQSFENFLADMGARPASSHSIERMDTNGHYTPDNCCWATIREQANNRRNNKVVTVDGQNYTVAQLSEKYNIHRGKIDRRLKAGLAIDEALRQIVPD